MGRDIEGYKHDDRWKKMVESKSIKGKRKENDATTFTKQLKTLNITSFVKDYRVSPIVIEPEVIGNSDL